MDVAAGMSPAGRQQSFAVTEEGRLIPAAFTPTGNTVTTTASTTSTLVPLPAGATSLRLLASAPAFLAFGTGSLVASPSTGMPLVSGAPEAIGIPAGATHYALVTSSGSASIAVTGGLGA